MFLHCIGKDMVIFHTGQWILAKSWIQMSKYTLYSLLQK